MYLDLAPLPEPPLPARQTNRARAAHHPPRRRGQLGRHPTARPLPTLRQHRLHHHPPQLGRPDGERAALPNQSIGLILFEWCSAFHNLRMTIDNHWQIEAHVFASATAARRAETRTRLGRRQGRGPSPARATPWKARGPRRSPRDSAETYSRPFPFFGMPFET